MMVFWIGLLVFPSFNLHAPTHLLARGFPTAMPHLLRCLTALHQTRSFFHQRDARLVVALCSLWRKTVAVSQRDISTCKCSLELWEHATSQTQICVDVCIYIYIDIFIYLLIYIYIYTLKYEGILSKHVHNSSMLRYLSHTSAKESQQKGSTRIVDLTVNSFLSTSCPSQTGPSRIPG